MNKYKNKEELYFSYYLDELINVGIISGYAYEEEKFDLFEGCTFSYTKVTELKTKTKYEDLTKTLLQPCTYTPDFIIIAPKAIKGLCGVLDTLGKQPLVASGKDAKIYVDVKGVFAGRTNSTQYTFPLKQKWMYQRYNIYTNKVVPYKIFKDTFTPSRVIQEEVYVRDIPKRGIKGGDSKLSFTPITINEWLKKLNLDNYIK